MKLNADVKTKIFAKKDNSESKEASNYYSQLNKNKWSVFFLGSELQQNLFIEKEY